MMVDSYIGHDQSVLELDSRVSPIHASENLTEALITCGTTDGLITDCRRLEEKLTAHGIPFETDYYEGMPHGFCQMEEMFPQARQSIERMITFLNRTLS
jgi:acetyl esterase/lipase